MERARSLSSENKYQIKRLKSRSPSSQYNDKRSMKPTAIQTHAKLQIDYKPYAQSSKVIEQTPQRDHVKSIKVANKQPTFYTPVGDVK